MPRARRYSCMRSVCATISRSATSPILQREDRKVAGNAGRPQRRLAAEAGRERLRRRRAGRRRDRADSGPASARWPRRRATGRYGGSAPASGSRRASSGARSSRGWSRRAIVCLDLVRDLADHGPERQRHLLVGRHADLPAQRQRPDRARSRRCPSAWRPARRPPASAIDAAAADEGAAVGFGFGRARRARNCPRRNAQAR